MKSTETELETQVLQTLEKMKKDYHTLDQLTQTMINRHAAGKSLEAEIEQMNQQRTRMMEFEQQSQAINIAYRDSREHASSAVKQLTDETAVLIERVIEAIAKLESTARQSYERLTPEVHRSIKGNLMKQAYGGAGT